MPTHACVHSIEDSGLVRCVRRDKGLGFFKCCYLLQTGGSIDLNFGIRSQRFGPQMRDIDQAADIAE